MNNQNVEKLEPTGIFTNYIFKAIPLAFDESMSYYETLCGLLDYLKNTIIPTINNNADVITEYETKFIELQTFVDTYFDNLDVQEEVNTKLDEMVEDGTMDTLLNTNLTGSLSDLETTDKTNLVSAINELNTDMGTNTSNIGDLTSLDTTEKSNLVGAINELNTDVSTNTSNIGNLTNLDTTNKTDLVNAINEVYNSTVYSSSEIAVGKWIDNKPLYRKVIQTNSLYPTDGHGNLVVAHGITNLDKVVKINCIAHNSNTYDYLLPGFYDFNNYCWFSTTVGDSAPKDLFNVFVDATNIIGHYNANTLLEADDVYFILAYLRRDAYLFNE